VQSIPPQHRQVSPEQRRAILSQTVQGEVRRGARVESQDDHSAVLIYRRRRDLVTVDDSGGVNVQQVSKRGSLRIGLLLTLVFVGMSVVVVMMMNQTDILPF